ncbi:DUF4410 domain-containing protein [Prosthecobacter sp.]|uniref:DUF4410 domain-containing protein n=1 Tax=Prosthecobacter sp. TaxID=1965333 RepID=UPI001D3B117B|nr:DUF4410 domain-containing protein [Prosthecobacter sp.]MCB1277782.1 DUF4410 domain-containing protein [Prosthecobacter sp.]
MNVNIARLLALAAASLLASCAGSTPDAKFSQPLSVQIAREDRIDTLVTSSDTAMIDSAQQRLGSKITSQVRALASARGGASHGYQLAVHISRYDKGNAFARSMLAGLGQMHLDGTIAVYQMPLRTKVGEFTMNKTFAWGGVYGMTMTMEAIEDTYAKAVAEAIHQRK